jgi:3-keto-L-gulonate-6-phosphate decarboxylase
VKRYGLGLAVAGGLNPGRIRRLRPYKDILRICIVGRYITASPNPVQATKRVKAAIKLLG